MRNEGVPLTLSSRKACFLDIIYGPGWQDALRLRKLDRLAKLVGELEGI